MKEFFNRSICLRILTGICIGLVFAWSWYIGVTKKSSDVTYNNRLHGVEMGMWDEDPGAEKFGGEFYVLGNEYLYLNEGDPLQANINEERFQQFLRPPAFRSACYTGNIAACKWVAVDIYNTDIKDQWKDFIVRILVSITVGVFSCIFLIKLLNMVVKKSQAG